MALGEDWRPRIHGSNTAMTEVFFYHLQAQPVERVLPVLLEKSLERGWRVVVHSTSEERVDSLDAHLWTFREESFLPHGTFREPTAADQPVLLTVRDDNPNGATVRFLLDRAPVPEDAGQYDRLVLLFDGGDDDAVAEARVRWQAAKARGFAVTYWQADGNGRWQRRA
jgi:DNA polymerase-3 subunit chi